MNVAGPTWSDHQLDAYPTEASSRLQYFKDYQINTSCVPASVAQLDVCPTGDQKVADVDPCQVANILSWKFDHEIFSKGILSLPLIQEGLFSVSGERMCTILVNSLED